MGGVHWPMFLFGTLGMGAGPSELGKSAREIWKLGKVEMCLNLKSTQTMSQDITKLNHLSYLCSLASETPRKL